MRNRSELEMSSQNGFKKKEKTNATLPVPFTAPACELARLVESGTRPPLVVPRDEFQIPKSHF
jgi:hypothetical protein